MGQHLVKQHRGPYRVPSAVRVQDLLERLSGIPPPIALRDHELPPGPCAGRRALQPLQSADQLLDPESQAAGTTHRAHRPGKKRDRAGQVERKLQEL